MSSTCPVFYIGVVLLLDGLPAKADRAPSAREAFLLKMDMEYDIFL
jgi:hypothetical protein